VNNTGTKKVSIVK